MNRQRKMLNHYLFKKRTEDYYPAQVKQARFAVQRLLAGPQEWERVFALYVAVHIRLLQVLILYILQDERYHLLQGCLRSRTTYH